MIELLALIVPFIWAGNADDGYHKVYLQEVLPGEKFMDGNPAVLPMTYGFFTLGMHGEGYDTETGERADTIQFLKGYHFYPDSYSCNARVWEHEWYHAMGYEHGQWPMVLVC